MIFRICGRLFRIQRLRFVYDGFGVVRMFRSSNYPDSRTLGLSRAMELRWGSGTKALDAVERLVGWVYNSL